MISRAGFEFVRDLVSRRAGVRLQPGLEYLLESRLLPLAREFKASSVNEFIRMMQSGAIRDGEQVLIEALADKETSFFRDVRPFETLWKNIVPELVAKRGTEKKLSIWSAGCSTGQEAYSIALVLHEHFPELLSWDVRILACDISMEVLRVAKTALFNQLEVNRGLPVALLVKYFQKDGLAWRLKQEVGRMIEFFQMNLLGDWPSLPSFDVVFLRNVVGGFAPEVQTEVIKNIARRLSPDGCLLLGAKDAPQGIGDFFEELRFDKVVCYRPKPGAQATDDGEAERSRQARLAEGWMRLAHLAARRGAASAEDLTNALSGDERLSTRLLAALQREVAEGKAPPLPDDGLLARARKEQLFAAALAEPAGKALVNAFMSMLSDGLETIDPASVEFGDQELVSAAAKLTGAASGTLFLRMKPDLARELTVQALGLSPEDVGPDVMKELIGQVVNLVADALNSSFNSAGFLCKVEAGEITQGKRTPPAGLAKGALELLAFQYQGRTNWLEIVVTSVEQRSGQR